MKRLAILALLFICGAVQGLAQPADMWGEQYEHSYPLPFFKLKDYNQIQSWAGDPSPRFNIYVMPVGVMFHDSQAEPTMELGLGVRINRYLYTGAETGINFRTTGVSWTGTKPDYNTYVPLALNVKGLLPVGERFCPFVSASAGGYFGIGKYDLRGTNGFYSSLKAGLEYNRACLTAGYSLIKLPSGFTGNFQIHLGLRIGR